jgi:Cu/Ag efflux pump CusA
LNFPKTPLAGRTQGAARWWPVGIMAALGGEFIPELEEGDFASTPACLTGSNLTNDHAETCNKRPAS